MSPYCFLYPSTLRIHRQGSLWKFRKHYIYFINSLDKIVFTYYYIVKQNKKTREKEEYIFINGITENRRRWDCGIALKMEWTFEGSPERIRVWTDGFRGRYLAAYMLVYEKEDRKVNLSGTADR